jgi:hypothetical protein
MSYFLNKLNGIYTPMMDADGGGSGEDGGDKQPEPEPDKQPDKDDDKKPDNEPKKVDLTQDELDALISREKGRVKSKYGDYDDLKAKLAEFEEAEEERKKAAMSEQDRLQAEKEAAEKRAQELEEQSKKAQESANQRIINTEIRAVARGLNANDPNDVLALLDNSNVEIDDNGNVKGVEEAVKSLKDSKSWLFKAPVGADAGGGSYPDKNPKPNELSAKEKELAELKQQAVNKPRLRGKVTKLANELRELKKKG